MKFEVIRTDGTDNMLELLLTSLNARSAVREPGSMETKQCAR